ncbi:MAG: SEFIR domain-containing protein [Sterolibacterium sp.]|jgi:hypothetical protein
MTRVFISYSHDDDDHKARIGALAQRLRDHGIPTTLDADMLPGGPDVGWPKWSEQQVVIHDKVLVACTRCYCTAYDATELPETDGQGGLGAACEAMAIRQTIYENRSTNPKFRVVLAAEADADHIPINLRAYHRYELWREDSVAQLLAWLKPAAVPAAAPAAVSWPARLPPRARGIANRDAEFACFERMLQGQSQERAMLVRATSNSGKTALLREFHNLLHKVDPQVAHCFVDLKGCVGIDAVLDELAADCGGLLGEFASSPPAHRPLALLRDLQNLPAPLVLSFDTFEQGSADFADWLQGRILQRIDRFPALRIIVAGQRVPEADKAVWVPHAATFDLAPIVEEKYWHDFGRDNYPHVPADELSRFIPGLVRATGGNPATIGTMLKNLAASFAGAGGRP